MDEIILDPLQQAAVDAACDVDKRVVAITGPAGTGKTTLLRKSFDALIAHGYRGALCAPTGKAAKRIYEATGIEACTIHRLLEYSHPGDPDPKTGKAIGYSAPSRTRSNPLELDFVFADEYAMVGHDLHRNLFDALPNHGRVCVFGDNNQLAPIEEDKTLDGQPSPFMNLLANDKFTSVKLETVFRQGADSGILLNANNLLKSRMPTKNDQWDMKITDQPVNVLTDHVLESLTLDPDDPLFGDFSKPQWQIIVPQNTSWVGSRKLNTVLQHQFFGGSDDKAMLVPRRPWIEGIGGIKGGDMKMYVGDKVMYTSNNYDLGIFNGETGNIINMDLEYGEITVDFGDREQTIPPVMMVMNRHGGTSTIDPRKDLDLAYAVTTHKVQGSEYKRIVYIMNKSNLYMLTRRNFYTAITRAKEHVTIIADQRGLASGVYKKG